MLVYPLFEIFCDLVDAYFVDAYFVDAYFVDADAYS